MGADVMMGHDPDCARWIKRSARRRRCGAAGEEAAAGGAKAAIGAARCNAEQGPADVSEQRPSRRIHAFRQARALRRGHAAAAGGAQLGVDIDSVCGGRACAGAARCWSPRASSPSTA